MGCRTSHETSASLPQHSCVSNQATVSDSLEPSIVNRSPEPILHPLSPIAPPTPISQPSRRSHTTTNHNTWSGYPTDNDRLHRTGNQIYRLHDSHMKSLKTVPSLRVTSAASCIKPLLCICQPTGYTQWISVSDELLLE